MPEGLAALRDTGVAFAVLAALFIPLERTFAARKQSYARPEIGLDLAYFVIQHALMLSVLLAFNGWLQAFVGPVSPRGLRHAVDTLPFALQVVLAIVAGDLLLYWGHRAEHAIPLLWRFHSIHHTATRMDWVAAHREHPLDGLFSQLCLNLPAFFLGVPIHVVAPLFVFRGLCATFVHTNVRIPLGPFAVLFGDPVLHRWHHARVDRCRHNFANVAPYLDLIFGTHHRPANEDYELGIGEPMSASLGRQMVHPFLPTRSE